MKIAITGATGGLGRNLTAYFLSQGHSVTALGRNQDIGRLLAQEGARFHAGDLGDLDYLRKVLDQQDVVVHAAALASPWGPWHEFERANVLGTGNVIKACAGRPLQRFIHISTPSIYFSGRPEENISEDAPLPEPQTHYARSKLEAEKLVNQAVDLHGLPAIILRPRAIFGPFDTVILPRIIKVMERGHFPLPVKGSAMTDVTFVDNVVHAVQLCIHADARYLGRVYNITNDEPLSVLQLTAMVAESMSLNVRFHNVPLGLLANLARFLEFQADHISHREPPLTQYTVGLLGITQTLCVNRAKAELGYQPITDIRSGLDIFSKWWRRTRAG